MNALIFAAWLAAAPNPASPTSPVAEATERASDPALSMGPSFSATTAAAALNIRPELVQAALSADDIRDVRRADGRRPWWPVIPALAAIVLAGLGAVWWRRRRTPELTPRDQATAMLEAAKVHLLNGETRKWAFASSDAVRFYLEAQLNIEASARTTDEILADVASSQGPLADRVQAFLRACDEAKFGNRRLSTDAMARLQQTALDVVGHGDDAEESEAA